MGGQREAHSCSSLGTEMWEPLTQGHKAWIQRVYTKVWVSRDVLMGAKLEKPHTISCQVQTPKTRIWGQDRASGSGRAGELRERCSGESCWMEGRDHLCIWEEVDTEDPSWPTPPPRTECQCSAGSVLLTSYFCGSCRSCYHEMSAPDVKALALHLALHHGSLAALDSELWFFFSWEVYLIIYSTWSEGCCAEGAGSCI